MYALGFYHIHHRPVRCQQYSKNNIFVTFVWLKFGHVQGVPVGLLSALTFSNELREDTRDFHHDSRTAGRVDGAEHPRVSMISEQHVPVWGTRDDIKSNIVSSRFAFRNQLKNNSVWIQCSARQCNMKFSISTLYLEQKLQMWIRDVEYMFYDVYEIQ